MKKILSGIVVVCMLLMSVCNICYAASFQPVIAVEGGSVGDTVTVTVSLPANTNAAGGSFNLVYDNTKTELVEAAAGEVISSFSKTVNKTYAENKIRVNFAGSETVSAEGGVILTATFKLTAAGTAAFSTEKFKLADIDTNYLTCADAEKSITVIEGQDPTEPSAEATESSEFTPVISAANGSVGDTVTVTVSLPANTNAAGGSFNLVYDKTKTELIDAVAGEVISSFSKTVNKTYAANKIRVNFAGSETVSAEGGVILTATFKLTAAGTAAFSTEKFKLADIDTNYLTCADAEKSITVIEGQGPTEPSSEATEPSSEATEPSSEATEPSSEVATLALVGNTSRSVMRNKTIIITTVPQNAPEGAYVAWSVEDPMIAEVVSTAGDYDNLGTIKGIRKGTTTVTATLYDKDGNILDYKIITLTVTGTSAGGGGTPLTVGTVSGRAGETVTVPITISDNPGIAGFNLVINYDNTLLTPVSIEKGAALTVGTLTSNIQQGGDLSRFDAVTAYWVNPSNVTENGEILNVTFEIAADAEEGEIPVTVTYEEGDVTNQDYEDIALDITDGYVTVINILPGDVYQDGVVNTKDGVRLSQYLAKWAVELTNAEEKAADVYQDGVINTKDGVRLSQYLAKWDVTLGTSTLMGMKLFSSAVIGFEVGKVNAKAGEYVDIPVYITKNTGVAGFNLQLNYDKALLTPVSITQGAALTSGTITSNIQQGGDLSRFDAVTAYWVNPSNITSTGEAFTVRFLVSESAEGEIPVTLSYDEYDVPCDQNLNELDVEIIDGSVITEGEPMPKAMDYTVNSLTGTVRDGSFYAEASVTKNTDRAAADTIVIAVYKDGALADMTYMKSEFAAGQTAVFGGRLTGTDGAVLKAFVWDSIEGMKALSNIIEK